MAIMHLMVGIQGSGKSTYSKKLANEIGAIIISSDEVRNMHPDWEEKMIFPEVYRLVAHYLANGKDVIFDATNITPNVRKRNIQNVRNLFSDFDIYLYFLNTSLESCKRRVERRNLIGDQPFIPLNVIESYHSNLIPPSQEELRENNYQKLIIIENEKDDNFEE